MKYKMQINDGVIFQKLVKDDDVIFGQLSIITVSPLFSTECHYHKRKTEWFCCVMGTGLLEIINIESGAKKHCILNGFKSREFIEVLPGFAHNIVNRDPYSDLEVLTIISEKFNQDDQDIFTYDEMVND